MRNIAKYLFVAVMAAFALASCEKEKVNPILNPDGTPVQFTFSARALSETEADLKVVSDVPVPADVTIAIALDGSNTMSSAGITFPSELTLKKGETEVIGQVSVDPEKLTPGTTTSAIFAASLAGVQIGTAKALTITTDPAVEPKPEPTGDSEIKIDGDFSDWDDVTTGIASDDEDAPLKEFKVAFDKEYLYFYHKRNNNPAMWGGGYFYLAVDADNNVATGMTDANGNAVVGIEKWMYLYFFLADDAGNPVLATAPAGARESGDEYVCAENSLAGAMFGDSVVETELRIPLADLGVTYGQPIKVYTWGNKSASNMKDQPVVVSMGGEAPSGGSVTIDGNPDDWSKLNQKYVTTLECYDGAELSGLKSAKVYYDDKVYVLLELSDAALTSAFSEGKLRAHVYFDGNYDNANGHYGKWVLPAIDYMLEGKIFSGDTWCAISSPYYQWTGTDPAVWSGGWTAAETSPAFEFAGDGSFYECAMDYSTYPGGLADAFTIAFDIQDDGYNTLGFLPNAGPEPGPMALVVKNGTEPPAAPTISIAIDGDFSDWALVEGVSNGAYGMFKAYSDADNLYFYTYRTTDGRYSALWGGSGYIYLGFDLDGNPDNGVELNSNGPYDFIGFFYPYGGTAEEPAFIDLPGVEGGWAPEEGYTLANMQCKGVANEKGAYIEYSIPRKDLPAFPNTPITITTWGNKDMSKVTMTTTL